MATYLALNIVFMVVVLAALGMARALSWDKYMTWLLVLLLVLTAIFDSLIIMAGIVDYNWSLLLGVTVGAAPIEDFFYAILVVLMVPMLWKRLGSDDVK